MFAEVIDTIRTNVELVISKEANRVADEIRNSTPANRTQTRKAVRVRRDGTLAKIYLQFAQQYQSRQTETHKRFATQWKRIRPESQRRLIAALNDAIQTAAK